MSRGVEKRGVLCGGMNHSSSILQVTDRPTPKIKDEAIPCYPRPRELLLAKLLYDRNVYKCERDQTDRQTDDATVKFWTHGDRLPAGDTSTSHQSVGQGQVVMVVVVVVMVVVVVTAGREEEGGVENKIVTESLES
ncbi:hypothetical protein Pmani_037709 [Petrolisthes manimaculis]|uniref:Uncharacterized protein n=1 Tax=Petrolisthes manimaculis TaxID=1843537 RepID=A0AAE1TN17_9EUCA|nr:hypothetical protein Pmani_037709 [Petrolisthes manimaculis]